MIKNKAKINREFTREELMKMVKKSERHIAYLKKRINYLEGILKTNKIKISK